MLFVVLIRLLKPVLINLQINVFSPSIERVNIILKSLERKSDQLIFLQDKYGLEYLFMVVIQIENNESPAMYLKKDIIDFASLIQAEIHFDVYIVS
ncbi:DUF4279 domain-containing protein [Bacillus sp. ISL-41]|nr:DUF4279 domain-containing protein [Bacillus sp. ISL-41]